MVVWSMWALVRVCWTEKVGQMCLDPSTYPPQQKTADKVEQLYIISKSLLSMRFTKDSITKCQLYMIQIHHVTVICGRQFCIIRIPQKYDYWVERITKIDNTQQQLHLYYIFVIFVLIFKLSNILSYTTQKKVF